MIVTHEFTVDVKQENQQVARIPQYNKDTHQLQITLADNGQKITLTSSGYQAYIKIAGTEGNFYNLSASINGSGIVVFTVPESVTAFSGRHHAQVDIVQTSNGSRLCSMPFIIYITPSVYTDDAVIASNEYESLTELLATAQDLINRLNTARTYYVIAAENSNKKYRIVCDSNGNLSTRLYT